MNTPEIITTLSKAESPFSESSMRDFSHKDTEGTEDKAMILCVLCASMRNYFRRLN